MPEFTEKKFCNSYAAFLADRNHGIQQTHAYFHKIIQNRIQRYTELSQFDLPSLIEAYRNDPDFFNASIVGDVHVPYLIFPQITPLTPEELSVKLKTLKESFANFKFLTYSESFTAFGWVVSCVVEYNHPKSNTYFKYNFGEFHIALNIDFTTQNYVVKALPCGNNKHSKANRRIYHPHIAENGRACIGSYGDFIKGDIINFNIIDMIYNISSVLQEYNPQSLYNGMDISGWIGNKCAVCLSFIMNPEEVVRCSKTMCEMHKACSVEIDDEFYNPVYIKACTRCGKSSPAWTARDGEIICGDCSCQQN